MDRSSSPLVIFSAAHAAFSAQTPLGGGATIANWLMREWERTQPFDFVVLGPGDAPATTERYRRIELPANLRKLTELTERQYAKFCYMFERATTDFIQSEAARRPVSVLANDISEGPDFEALGARGIPVTTIFHVDVVDYFCKFYLRGVKPEKMTRWYEKLRARGLHRAVPRLLRLVFEKQRAAVTHSRHLLVPSAPMKEIILRCYPQAPAERVSVVPWGGYDDAIDEGEVETEKGRLREELGLSPWDIVLLTLGRISPEKGIAVLLEALQWLESRDDVLTRWEMRKGVTDMRSTRGVRLHLLICGEAAYMRGSRYLRKLKSMASELKHIRVDFVGHVSGVRKQALLRTANLYVHPSVHESYGLTMVEAMGAGLPVLTFDNYSAHSLVTDDCGRIVPMIRGHHLGWRGLVQRFKVVLNPLEQALDQLLWKPERLRTMGQRAHERALAMRFEDAAATVAHLTCSQE